MQITWYWYQGSLLIAWEVNAWGKVVSQLSVWFCLHECPVKFMPVHIFCVSGASGTKGRNGLCPLGPSVVGKVFQKWHNPQMAQIFSGNRIARSRRGLKHKVDDARSAKICQRQQKWIWKICQSQRKAEKTKLDSETTVAEIITFKRCYFHAYIKRSNLSSLLFFFFLIN